MRARIDSLHLNCLKQTFFFFFLKQPCPGSRQLCAHTHFVSWIWLHTSYNIRTHVYFNLSFLFVWQPSDIFWSGENLLMLKTVDHFSNRQMYMRLSCTFIIKWSHLWEIALQDGLMKPFSPTGNMIDLFTSTQWVEKRHYLVFLIRQWNLSSSKRLSPSQRTDETSLSPVSVVSCCSGFTFILHLSVSFVAQLNAVVWNLLTSDSAEYENNIDVFCTGFLWSITQIQLKVSAVVSFQTSMSSIELQIISSENVSPASNWLVFIFLVQCKLQKA